MSLDTRDFLDSIAGYTNGSTSTPGAPSVPPVRLGTIDPYYTSGPARVTFDGETTLSDKGFSWNTLYSPTAGDRVYLIPVGTTYIISGAFSSAIPFNKFYNLSLQHGWAYYGGGFRNAMVTKTPSSVVQVTGLIKGGTVTAGTVIANLPEPFRPIIKQTFTALTFTTTYISATVSVYPNGDIVLKGSNATTTLVSLDNIIFNNDPLLSWTTTSVFPAGWNPYDQSDLAGITNVGFAKDIVGRVWTRGQGYNATSPASSVTLFQYPTGFTPSAGKNSQGVNSGNNTFGAHYVDTSGNYIVHGPGTGTQPLSFDESLFIADTVGSWTNPTLTNAWTTYAAGYDTPGYWKDPEGMVHLRGMAAAGTVASPIFTLPVGYRPASTILRVCSSNYAVGRLDIKADGTVTLQQGANNWVNLSGVSFFPEQ